jgi:penicillin-binding protein 1A
MSPSVAAATSAPEWPAVSGTLTTVRTGLRVVLIALLAGVALAAAVVALALPVQAVVDRGASSVDNAIANIDAPRSERSTVYASDGSVLAVLHANENRSPVSISRVPPAVINAVIDTEDSRFFTHGAVDLKSTVRALASNVQSGVVREGGSTITQQLVKTIFLTPQRHLDRKIKEAVIASRIEKKYTKNQILEAYLNAVYFGNSAYGVQAAAETYFNEDITQVTPVQAALIGGLIQDPSGYDPIANPKDSKSRRDFVLDRMAHYGHLTQVQADALKATPVPAALSKPLGTADTKDDYYVEQVKQIVLNQSTTLGNTYTERYNALFRGGLKIYTNLDPRLQDLAEQKVAGGIPANRQGFTGALASIEPATGKVRAIVGGPGFDTYKYDLATQAFRQPGSGFKIFTLLAAYEAGYAPNDSVDGSSPCAIDFPGFSHDYLKKPANNSEGNASGAISVLSATANSVNCAYLRIAHEVGLPKVVDMAHRLGLSEKFLAVPSIVIGSEGVTVLEMAGAYATLATDGVYHQPSFIDRVVDRTGATIFKNSPTGKRVLDPQIARLAAQTLRSVVQYGTGTAAALPDRPVIGKTGTTEHNTDAWFNGVTPQLATSIWMGDPKARTPMFNVGGITVFGGTYPARIWHAYTEAALLGQPAFDFIGPDPSKIPGYRFISSPSLQRDTGFSGAPTTLFPTHRTFPPNGGPSPTVPGTPPPAAPPTAKPPPTTKGPPPTAPPAT